MPTRPYRTLLMAMALLSALASTSAQAPHNPDAVRLNNNGVALMNQQQTERAQTAFAQAIAKDPAFPEAALNNGIALLYLQKVPEATAALKSAAALSPGNPRIWYNLGLVDRAANDLAAAVASFQKAVDLDPSDADSWYFTGVCLQDLKQPEQAITAFTTALQKNPLHASSEFALARALQRSGHPDQAREHFQRFQHLTSTKISTALGLSYGDQGRYSMAVAFAEPPRLAPAMIPVHLESHPLLPKSTAAQNVATGGSCMIDFDNDGLYDLVLMSSGPNAIRLLRNQGDGSFEEIPSTQTGLTATGHAISCTAGDYDNDGLPDLAVALDDSQQPQLLLFHNQGKGHFENTTQPSGLIAHNHPQGITFLDYDHDGDLDLFLTGSALQPGGPANLLWRNNGNRAFTEVTEPTALGGSGHTTSAILTDLNNDRAVDIVVAGDGPSPLLYLNPREGKYPSQPLFTDPALAPSTGVTVLDFNKDGWMDLAITHAGAPGITLWRNIPGQGPGIADRKFERVNLPITDATRAWGITPIDFDNDGFIDLAVLIESTHGPELRILRNLGDGTFADVSKALALDKLTLKDPRGLIAVDAAHDGAAGLILTSATSDPVFLRNIGGNKNHSVRLKLTGFADNKSAIGTKVEIFSTNAAQKYEIPGASGYLTQGPPELIVGLGPAPGIDMVRMLWPTGVPQDEIAIAPKPDLALTEADRRGSSCPVLFAWNGQHFGLITDTIGAAVVGHWFTPSRRNISDPDEWIKVDGSQLAALNGRLSLRFTEPMEEVNYIDQLRLRAIDHPIGTEVYPDERFLDNPPFATGRAILTAAARLPLAAHDDQGRDVLPLIANADHNFASSFTKLPYDGFANPHALTLDLGSRDLGPKSPTAPLRLLLTGYVEYFSATSLYSAWQAGIAPISPYIEAQLPNGSWQLIEKDMGFPAGLERTIVVDLTHKLPARATKIRITTNLQIYWDQIRIDSSAENPTQIRQTEIPLALASLRFHGYPRQIDGVSPGDLEYNYDQVSLTGPFQRQRGSYTRFGDVTPLVSGVDNRFAIFGSGEEIAADFDATHLPPLPPHWQRDYFFYANGYVKDMDYYDALPFTVAQLPFHGMTTYPYPNSESFPADPAAIAYQLNWNDRFDTGTPSQSFRFDYQPHPSTPQDSTHP